MSDNNFGIKVSAPNISAGSATGSNVIFSTKNPFYKIDTQNSKGFPTVNLFFAHDPPEPVSPSNQQDTIVYQFAHGYTYKPAIATLFYVSTPPAGGQAYQQYFYNFGYISQVDVLDIAYMYSVADATNLYIVVAKRSSGLANNLTGMGVKFTCYVPVEDVGV